METFKGKESVKVGLVGIGLNTYWDQFQELLPRLISYQNNICEHMTALHAEVINVGMVDSPQKANLAVDQLKTNDVELLFIFISTYALSSTILPVAQRIKVPVILLNIQPVSAINYNFINSMDDRGKMTGEWLAHCQACSLPELACVFNKTGIRYEIVTGHLQEKRVWTEIGSWISAAYAVKGMRENRMGILGHYYGGMLDVYSDSTLHSGTFGTHIEILEMCELKAYWDAVTHEEIVEKIEEFHNCFEVISKCEEYEITRAARTSVSLDKLVAAHQLGSMAYYYEGVSGNSYENIITSVIAGNTLLTGKDIPVAGECEIKNVQAMKILSLLNAGGSFSEFYALDFDDDVVLLGHDGPAHFAMAEEKVKLVPLPIYHGKPGKGLSIQMSVKAGPVTLLTVCERKEGICLLIAEGEAVDGPTLQIGNTNSRYRFGCGARSFIEKWSKEGPSHHCAIGTGHLADKLKNVAFLLDIPIIEIK